MASRRRGTAVRTALTLALGVALLAGCNTVVGVERPTLIPVPDAVVQHRVSCPLPENGSGVTTPTLPEPGRVPDGFVPVAAVECPVNASVTDQDGKWSAVEEVRYTGDLAPLLAALAEADDRPGVNQACDAMLVIVPPLWLVDASGRAVLAHHPVDVCGKPKGGVSAALQELTVESRKTTKVALLVPRAALDAECDTGWKLEPPSSHATASPPAAPSTAVDTLRVCRYDVDPAQTFDNGDGIHVSVGTFSSGGELRGDDVERAIQLTASGGPAPPCTTDPTRFAVVLPVLGDDTGGPVWWVELDGCRRTWSQDSVPRTAPTELLGLVAG